MPAISPFRNFATGGGLTSSGPDLIDPHRRAAGYVDRILEGEKPANLPAQAPAKFKLVINLKTAKALGLNVPPSLLATADEVIEWTRFEDRRLIHHSPIFWIGIVLCLAAIAIYLWSDDLSWQPAPIPR